jgi:hypothetical protein
MATKELVFDLSEIKDLRIGVVCPGCKTEMVFHLLKPEFPQHFCTGDSAERYEQEVVRDLLGRLRDLLERLLEEVKPPIQVHVSLPGWCMKSTATPTPPEPA